jgi:hypothetical protein
MNSRGPVTLRPHPSGKVSVTPTKPCRSAGDRSHLPDSQASGRPISQPDAVIAAIARSRNATVATRDSKGFEHCGVSLINPWNE